MLDFDLAKTAAGKELINMGLIDGLEKGLKKGEKKGLIEGRLQKAQEMLIWTYEEKWGEPPEHITNAIKKIFVNETLNELFKIMIKNDNRNIFERSLILAVREQ